MAASTASPPAPASVGMGRVGSTSGARAASRSSRTTGIIPGVGMVLRAPRSPPPLWLWCLSSVPGAFQLTEPWRLTAVHAAKLNAVVVPCVGEQRSWAARLPSSRNRLHKGKGTLASDGMEWWWWRRRKSVCVEREEEGEGKGGHRDFDAVGGAVHDTQSETVKTWRTTKKQPQPARYWGRRPRRHHGDHTSAPLFGPAHPCQARCMYPTSSGPSSRPWPPCSGLSARGDRARRSTPCPSQWRTTRCCPTSASWPT